MSREADPSATRCALRLGGHFLYARGRKSEVECDGFSDAVDAVDAAAGEGLDDLVGRGFEGLGLVAGLYTDNRLAVNAGVDAVGDGFDFGEFWHGLGQYSLCGVGWGAGVCRKRIRVIGAGGSSYTVCL